jgi:hypothetical protein
VALCHGPIGSLGRPHESGVEPQGFKHPIPEQIFPRVPGGLLEEMSQKGRTQIGVLPLPPASDVVVAQPFGLRRRPTGSR